MIGYQQKIHQYIALDEGYLPMCFLIIADHPLEYAIEKTVIGDNRQNQQLHTITHDYFANVQSNLVEPRLFLVYVSYIFWRLCICKWSFGYGHIIHQRIALDEFF
jgi:hypothetical protein